MIETVPGHRYVVPNIEDPLEAKTVIQFIHKEPVGDEAGTLRLVSDGCQRDEVLKVLISSYQYVQSKFPCRENAVTITLLEEALMWQEKRTSDRKARNVEGKQLK